MPADVDTFRAFVDGTELFGEDTLLQFTARHGCHAREHRRQAAMASFGLNLVASLAESGASELEVHRGSPRTPRARSSRASRRRWPRCSCTTSRPPSNGSP